MKGSKYDLWYDLWYELFIDVKVIIGIDVVTLTVKFDYGS